MNNLFAFLHFSHRLENGVCHIFDLFLGKTVQRKMCESLVEYLFAVRTCLSYFIRIVAHILNYLETIKRTEVCYLSYTLFLKLFLENLDVAAGLGGIYLEKVQMISRLNVVTVKKLRNDSIVFSKSVSEIFCCLASCLDDLFITGDLKSETKTLNLGCGGVTRYKGFLLAGDGRDVIEPILNGAGEVKSEKTSSLHMGSVSGN